MKDTLPSLNIRTITRNGQTVQTASSLVFVTQEANHDYRRAEKFGELTFMTLTGRDDFNNIRGGENNRRMVAHLKHCLKDFDEERDFIVLTGSPYINAAVSMILGARRVKQVQFLRWDNRDFVYIPLVIELDQQETMSHG